MIANAREVAVVEVDAGAATVVVLDTAVAVVAGADFVVVGAAAELWDEEQPAAMSSAAGHRNHLERFILRLDTPRPG